MDLLDLVEEMELKPRKTSSSHGGEYHCQCPRCGGRDRFMFWPNENRYWCRQCHAKGDAIQFCRDFQKLSFQTAIMKTKKGFPPLAFRSKPCSTLLPTPQISPQLWEDQARAFAVHASQRLLIDKTATRLTKERGLSLDTIEKYLLGWSPTKSFQKRAKWGLEEMREREWICLPAGLVIPLFEDGVIRRLKIRKSEWKEGDPQGKYYEVPGNSNMMPIFGDPSKEVVVIVEAELDAMLIAQEAKDLCSCVALGGAQKKPTSTLRQWLQSKQLILFALDFDTAGKAAFPYWESHYTNLEPWPVPEEKSPGDYHAKGGSLSEWIFIGVKKFTNSL